MWRGGAGPCTAQLPFGARSSVPAHAEEAGTLTRTGDTHHAMGDHDAASRVWQDALVILTELARPDADRLRARLRCARAVPVRRRRTADGG